MARVVVPRVVFNLSNTASKRGYYSMLSHRETEQIQKRLYNANKAIYASDKFSTELHGFSIIEIIDKNVSKYIANSDDNSMAKGCYKIINSGVRFIQQERDLTENVTIDIQGTEILFKKVLAPSPKSLKVYTYKGVKILEKVNSRTFNFLINLNDITYHGSNTGSNMTYSEVDTNRDLVVSFLFEMLNTILKLEKGYTLDAIIAVVEEESKSKRNRELIECLSSFVVASYRGKVNDYNECQSRIVEISEQIRRREQELIKVRKQIAITSQELTDLEASTKAKVDNLVADLSHIESFPLIKEFKITEGRSDGYNVNSFTFTILTEKIYIVNASKRYYIGEFKIEIPLHINSRDTRSLFNIENVTLTNDKNRRRSVWGNNCHHPHINQNGKPCWGEISGHITKMFNELEFTAGISLIIGYLQSVNTSDIAGKYITYWDVVDNEGNVKIEGYDFNHPPKGIETVSCTKCGFPDIARDMNKTVQTRQGVTVHLCDACAYTYDVCSVCGTLRTENQCDTCIDEHGNEIKICKERVRRDCLPKFNKEISEAQRKKAEEEAMQKEKDANVEYITDANVEYITDANGHLTDANIFHSIFGNPPNPVNLVDVARDAVADVANTVERTYEFAERATYVNQTVAPPSPPRRFVQVDNIPERNENLTTFLDGGGNFRCGICRNIHETNEHAMTCEVCTETYCDDCITFDGGRYICTRCLNGN